MQTEAVPQTSPQHYFLHWNHVQYIGRKEGEKKSQVPSSFPCPGTALTILQGYCYKLLRSAKVALGDIKAAESKLESAKLPFPTVLVSDLFTLTFGSSIPKSSYFSVRPQNKSAQKRKEKPSAQSVREGNRAFSFLPSCLPSHMHGLRKLHKT